MNSLKIGIIHFVIGNKKEIEVSASSNNVRGFFIYVIRHFLDLKCRI